MVRLCLFHGGSPNVRSMIFGDQSPANLHRQAEPAAGVQFCLALACVLFAASLAQAIAMPMVGRAHSGNEVRGERPAGATDVGAGSSSIAGADGQSYVWYTRYTLRLKSDSGAEQSIVVMAPPGGLQLAVRDMTGDHVSNDVVVTPALLHWPLTVLVNDGHNHFTVAISAKIPDPVASQQNRASGTGGMADISGLVSTGFEMHMLANRGGILPPTWQEGFHSSGSTAATLSCTFLSGSGRAPPLVTNL